jgi:cell wall-associated NlpC family hydrolase
VVYQQIVGVTLPRTSDQQAAVTETIEMKDLAPGDLVFFNTLRQAFSHVGIYVGEGRFVHAPRTGERIRLERLSARYWTDRFDGARRVLAHRDNTPETRQP